jgi:glycosyltransferase involved in cell wall biosynthesis
MRIIYITLENMSLHKGSVVHVKELIIGLRKLGHQVTLIAPALGKLEDADCCYDIHPNAINFIRFLGLKKKSYFISLVSLFLHLLRVLPRSDVIYAREYYAVLVALLPRLLFKRKLIFEMNGLASEEQKLRDESFMNRIFSSLIKITERLATRCSDRIVSVTPQIASHLTTHYDCPPEKVLVIENGANTDRFHPIDDEELLLGLKRELRIERHEYIVAFVGNLAPWQGVEYLINAAPLLVRDIENIRFLIIGDGVLKGKFEEDVNKLRVADHFIFTGMVDYQQIPLYMNIADVCVVLKRKLRSGYSPLKLYEYMACGKPVVASRVEGLEFIEEEGAGQLIEPEDVIGLEKALQDLFRNSNKRVAMGVKGLQIAREKFSWDSRAMEISRILSAI